MRTFFLIFAFVLVAAVSIFGFRGQKTRHTPLYLFPDMDRQAKFHPQGENTFYANRMNDRPAPLGAVARGTGLEEPAVFAADYRHPTLETPSLATGKNPDGTELAVIPLPVTYELMELGRRKYEIYCTVCHGALGEGNGVTQNYGVIAANLQTPVYLERPDGNLYNTITNGYNTMMGYGEKLSVEERWAVVAYVRALQKMFNARETDLSPQQKKELGL